MDEGILVLSYPMYNTRSSIEDEQKNSTAQPDLNGAMCNIAPLFFVLTLELHEIYCHAQSRRPSCRYEHPLNVLLRLERAWRFSTIWVFHEHEERLEYFAKKNFVWYEGGCIIACCSRQGSSFPRCRTILRSISSISPPQL